MRKIIVGAQISMDGIMQAPGGPDEDPTHGFPFGGWAMAFFPNPLFREELMLILNEECDLLLGRKTYEIFAAYWPYYDENAPAGAIARLFNTITKYVVSRSGEVDTGWQNTVLLRDIDAVKRLRDEGGRDLITQGSTELVHALFAHDLVDRLSTFALPVVLGGGKKLFADGSAPHTWTLTGTRSGNGLVVSHFERAGEVRTAAAPPAAPSERERARRERMKREG